MLVVHFRRYKNSLAKELFVDTTIVFIYLTVKKSHLYLSANQIMLKRNIILILKTGKIIGKKMLSV